MLSMFIKSDVTLNKNTECQTTKIDADETKIIIIIKKTNSITISSATKSLIRNASQAEKKTHKYFQYCVKMCMVFAKKLQESSTLKCSILRTASSLSPALSMNLIFLQTTLNVWMIRPFIVNG